MKKYLLIFISLILVILTACSPENEPPVIPDEETSSYRTISAEGVKALLDNQKNFVLVDVRRADEYESAHIPGAILIPNEDIGETRPEQLPDLNATVILYCRSGNRSAEAAEKLIKLGYTDVRDMGGINDWPYDVISGMETGVWNAPTEPVHNGILSSFTAASLSGASVDESILVDYEITMVNIWATYCGPCINEMPELGELAEEYKSKGVQIVGLVSDTVYSNGELIPARIDTAKEIVRATGANYIHILPSADFNPLLADVTAVPTTIFVDKYGNQVGDVYLGAKNKATWTAIIDDILAEARK